MASYEMECPTVRIEVHRSSNDENVSEDTAYFFWSAVNFLESVASEIKKFNNFPFSVRLQVRKTPRGCLVQFSKISRTCDKESYVKYTIDDFESLASMQCDMVTLKTDMAKEHIQEISRPSLEELFQSDTLEMSC